MIKNFISGRLDAKTHLQIFKTLLIICNGIGLLLYGFMHLILFDFPFEPANEITVLMKLFAVASSFAIAISGLLLLAEIADYLIKRRRERLIPLHVKTISLAGLILLIILSSCNGPISKGIKKDFNTGMVSSYTNMEPEKVSLVMNDEILNHTDIPLGESFLLVNEKIKGMKVKDGKISVGCSLQITDQKGKVLLQEKDLFAGHDIYDEKDASYLKCTVSTGKPMEWEEKYDVAVTFWDKYGDGKIDNKVTIRCIDMP
ncbi:MAG: hypothetical protein QM791_13130 [Ferruginibacter sp.]